MKRLVLVMIAVGSFAFAQVAQAQWTPAKRLTWTSGHSSFPTIARDLTGTLHVLWVDETPGNGEIYHKTSTDGGATWTPNQRLTWNSGNSGWPVMTADSSNNIHVLWEDDTPGKGEIFHKKSTDLGDTWLASQNLSSTPGDSWNAAIALDFSFSAKLHAFWNDNTPGNHEIYYKRSTDGGDTWTTSQRLTWTPGGSWSPEIAVDYSNNIHVVWFEYTAGNAEIYYKKSTDGGVTWTASQRLTWTSGFSFEPAIAADSSGNIHVVWYDNSPGNNEIYYRRSPDKGTTWGSLRKLTWTAGESCYPEIAVDSSGDIHLVWWDNTPGNAEIYYKKSTDRGASWTSSQRLTSTSGDSYSPFIAVDPFGGLHVVWHDDTPGNFEIYYKKFSK